MFLCGNILTQTAHAQCYWERGADSDMNARACLFVWGLLAAIALGGDERGDGGAWAGAGYEVGHSVCSVAVTA